MGRVRRLCSRRARSAPGRRKGRRRRPVSVLRYCCTVASTIGRVGEGCRPSVALRYVLEVSQPSGFDRRQGPDSYVVRGSDYEARGCGFAPRDGQIFVCD